MSERTCTECERPVSEWAMCFKGDPQCSDLCHKAAKNKHVSVPVEPLPEITMTADE